MADSTLRIQVPEPPEEPLAEAAASRTFEFAPVGIAHVAPDGRLLRANPRFCEIVGYPADELLRLRFQDLTHPDDLAGDLDQALRTLAGEQSGYEMEKRYRRKDGEVVWVLLRAALVREPVTQQPLHFVSVVEDVTAQRRRPGPEPGELRRVAEAIPQLVWLTMPDGTLDYYNERWFAYTGMARDGSQEWAAFLHPDDVPPALRTWHAALASGAPYECEYRLRRAEDGRYRWFLARALLLPDADGRAARWFGTCTDIDEQKRTTERLRRLQAVTAALTAALTPDEVAAVVAQQGAIALGAHAGAVALLRADGQALHFLGWYGYPESHIRAWQDVPLGAAAPITDSTRTGEPFWFEDQAAWNAAYPQLAAASQVIPSGAWAVLPLVSGGQAIGAVALSFRAARRFDAEDRALGLALARQGAQALDRARLFAAEHAARAEAEAASRAKSEFLATMSHELRTPLNAIGGYVELMELGLQGPVTEAQRQGLERIRINQQHLLTLIDDLLNFTRLETGRLELELQPLLLAPLLGAVEAVAGPRLREKQLVYTCQPAAPGLAVRADERRLLQLLLNRVDNAIKFTPAGGWVALDAAAAGERVRIRLSDSGPGIPPQKLDAVFEPFVQLGRHLDQPREGLGLGLAISRALARAMGGDLVAQSAPGRGAAFVLTLSTPDTGTGG